MLTPEPLHRFYGSTNLAPHRHLLHAPAGRRLVGAFIGVLGTVNDFAGAAVASASNLMVFGAGMMPVLADTLCSGTNALVAQLGMRLVAGRAKADRLAFS